MLYNHNKLTHIKQLYPFQNGRNYIGEPYVEGYPAFTLFAFNYAGLDKDGDPQVRLADKTVTKGMDAGNTPRSGDMLNMGVWQPKWSSGLSNSFSYRNFSLNINMVGYFGHVMFRDVNRSYFGNVYISSQDFQSGNFHAEFADRWKAPGDEARTDIPRFINDAAVSAGRNVDYYIYSSKNVIRASLHQVARHRLCVCFATQCAAKSESRAAIAEGSVEQPVVMEAEQVWYRS